MRPIVAVMGLALSALSLGAVIRLWLLQGEQTLFGATRCWLRGHHDPKRVPFVGGFRCATCHLAGSDLTEFGLDGFVNPERRLFDRDARPSSPERIQ